MKEERKPDDDKIVLPWSKIRLGCFSTAWHITWPRGLLRFGGKCRRIYNRIILPCCSNTSRGSRVNARWKHSIMAILSTREIGYGLVLEHESRSTKACMSPEHFIHKQTRYQRALELWWLIEH